MTDERTSRHPRESYERMGDLWASSLESCSPRKETSDNRAKTLKGKTCLTSTQYEANR